MILKKNETHSSKRNHARTFFNCYTQQRELNIDFHKIN